MNADRVATTCAKRAKRGVEGVLGTVIVNLQCTRHDLLSSLRIFARIDDVMRALMRHMGLPVCRPHATAVPTTNVFSVQYDLNGQPKPEGEPMTLDLRVKSWLRVTMGPNKGCCALVTDIDTMGHYRIKVFVRNKTEGTFTSISRILGRWWAEDATRMAVHYLPVVNVQAGKRIPQQLLQVEAEL
jgi:hypothetical protein